MNPRFVRVRPDMLVEEAIRYVRKQASHREIYYAYVLDEAQHLQGVLSFRELMMLRPDQRVRDVMKKRQVTPSPSSWSRRR